MVLLDSKTLEIWKKIHEPAQSKLTFFFFSFFLSLSSSSKLFEWVFKIRQQAVLALPHLSVLSRRHCWMHTWQTSDLQVVIWMPKHPPAGLLVSIHHFLVHWILGLAFAITLFGTCALREDSSYIWVSVGEGLTIILEWLQGLTAAHAPANADKARILQALHEAACQRTCSQSFATLNLGVGSGFLSLWNCPRTSQRLQLELHVSVVRGEFEGTRVMIMPCAIEIQAGWSHAGGPALVAEGVPLLLGAALMGVGALIHRQVRKHGRAERRRAKLSDAVEYQSRCTWVPCG